MSGPRIRPGTPAEIGRLNTLITRAIGRASRTDRPPNLFTTLARRRGLFRGWLMFAGRLMPGGTLPREDTELVILRVAHNCRCEYEWRHHERLAQAAGLSRADVERTRGDRAAPAWSERQRALLWAADELHERRELSDDAWAELSRHLTEPELIELCLLIGHYEMLAMTINSLRIEPDTFGGDANGAAQATRRQARPHHRRRARDRRRDGTAVEPARGASRRRRDRARAARAGGA